MGKLVSPLKSASRHIRRVKGFNPSEAVTQAAEPPKRSATRGTSRKSSQSKKQS